MEDAVRAGLKKAAESIKNIQGAWVNEVKVVTAPDGAITEWRVNMRVTVVVDCRRSVRGAVRRRQQRLQAVDVGRVLAAERPQRRQRFGEQRAPGRGLAGLQQQPAPERAQAL